MKKISLKLKAFNNEANLVIDYLVENASDETIQIINGLTRRNQAKGGHYSDAKVALISVQGKTIRI